MATGEERDDESLGGADMHARVSGWPTTSRCDEPDAIRIGRRIVARLNWRKQGPAPAAPIRAPPLFDEERAARHRAGRPAASRSTRAR